MTPDIYPQKLDLAQKRVLMIRMREEDYRAASFLDDRMLTAESKGAWIPLEQVMANAKPIDPRPLHFIFHTGHVGSTLLSRLLGETGGVLSLREPLPLRTLADAFDEPETDGLRETALEAFLKLWGRGYDHINTVVLKATSNAARLGERMLKMLPNARSVYLSLPRDGAIEALLSSQYAAVDLEAFGAERWKRLRNLLGDAQIDQPKTAGEMAAMSWAVEQLTHRSLSAQYGERILNIDFETFLDDMPGCLAPVMAHFGLETTPEMLDALMKSPILSQYSKKLQRPYSVHKRAQILAETRVSKAEEIARAHDWLERLYIAADTDVLFE